MTASIVIQTQKKHCGLLPKGSGLPRSPLIAFIASSEIMQLGLLDARERSYYLMLISRKEAFERLGELDGWQIHGKNLVKVYPFKGFKEGLKFVNEVGVLAEEKGHHPDVQLGYSEVVLEITIHSVGGLTEKDFELAAAIDRIR